MPDVNGYVDIVPGEQLLIKIGDGESPETFAHSCLINSTRGVSFVNNVTETEVAKCTDQSAPAQIRRKVKSTDFTPSGAGRVDAGSVWPFLEWLLSGAAKNVEIHQNPGSVNGFVGRGQLLLKKFDIKGDRGDFQEDDVEWVPASTFEWEQNEA